MQRRGGRGEDRRRGVADRRRRPPTGGPRHRAARAAAPACCRSTGRGWRCATSSAAGTARWSAPAGTGAPPPTWTGRSWSTRSSSSGCTAPPPRCASRTSPLRRASCGPGRSASRPRASGRAWARACSPPDGRHVGFLGLFTESPIRPVRRRPRPACRPRAGAGPGGRPAAVRHRGGSDGALRDRRGLLTRSAASRPLPGLPGHAALRPGSPVLAAARARLDGPQTSFLLPAPASPAATCASPVWTCPRTPRTT